MHQRHPTVLLKDGSCRVRFITLSAPAKLSTRDKHRCLLQLTDGLNIKQAALNEIDKGYYETPNPYVNAPSCPVNLLELSRYARKKGKKLADLSQDEVNQFLI